MSNTQNKRLLAHLKSGKPIEPLQALQQLGIYRLGARIFDLKARGYAIATELVEVSNAYGGTSRVARYTLQ